MHGCNGSVCLYVCVSALEKKFNNLMEWKNLYEIFRNSETVQVILAGVSDQSASREQPWAEIIIVIEVPQNEEFLTKASLVLMPYF
jgi:hypothetical protein